MGSSAGGARDDRANAQDERQSQYAILAYNCRFLASVAVCAARDFAVACPEHPGKPR
jgi:hypothetical protein